MNLPQDCQVISIPTAQKEIRKRFDDPVRFMVSDAAQLSKRKYNNSILKLARLKQDQVGLTYIQRESNMANIFKVNKLADQVVVCDDVVTSGATLRSANRALQKLGIEVLANICLANTPKTLQ